MTKDPVPPDLTENSASDLSAMIAARSVRPSDVTAAYPDRIEAANPAVNALVSLRDRDDLMAEARTADDAPRRGWLHGMPFAVQGCLRDQVAAHDLGRAALCRPHPDAVDLLAARRRAAGAICIGKTSVPERGQGRHTFNLRSLARPAIPMT